MKKNSVTVETLQNGQSILQSIGPCKNPAKVALKVGQFVSQPSALSSFNTTDKNFRQRSPRFGWMYVMAAELIENWPAFKTEIEAALKGKEVEVNVLNPTHPQHGMLGVQITENTAYELGILYAETDSQKIKDDIDYKFENFETRAKRAGKDGDFLLNQGSPIFSDADVEYVSLIQHQWRPTTGRVATVEQLQVGTSLADPVSQEEPQEAAV
jgi:hypothetical protein